MSTDLLSFEHPSVFLFCISTSSTKFEFFGAIGKTRWQPWPLIGWDIFDISKTAEQNSTKLDRKQNLNVPYQVCVFGADRKSKMAALWLAQTFSTSALKRLNGIQRNLTGSKISMSFTKFVFFRAVENTRWLPWPLICWDIFEFFSKTAERNSTKLYRKQVLNAFYQVRVFQADRKTRWPPWPLICRDIFGFFSETAEQNSTKLHRMQDLNVLYQVCVFRADRKNKMNALASDWLRHFRLLLWNGWKEFHETRQNAKSQRPLNSLCFSGRSEKQDGRSDLWLAESFSTSSLKRLNGIQQNFTGRKISTSSTKFVFFGQIGNTWSTPWSLIGWYIFDSNSAIATQNSTKLDRKQDLNVLYQVCVFRADWKRKRKRSDSVLWQKLLHQQKCQKGKVTTQTTPQKSSITQRLRTDLGRSVGVTTATQLVWLTGLRVHLPTNRNSRVIKRTHV